MLFSRTLRPNILALKQFFKIFEFIIFLDNKFIKVKLIVNFPQMKIYYYSFKYKNNINILHKYQNHYLIFNKILTVMFNNYRLTNTPNW